MNTAVKIASLASAAAVASPSIAATAKVPVVTIKPHGVPEAYLEWLENERRLLQIELYPEMGEFTYSPVGTAARHFHFPQGQSWAEVAKPSTRAQLVLSTVGVVQPIPEPADALLLTLGKTLRGLLDDYYLAYEAQQKLRPAVDRAEARLCKKKMEMVEAFRQAKLTRTGKKWVAAMARLNRLCDPVHEIADKILGMEAHSPQGAAFIALAAAFCNWGYGDPMDIEIARMVQSAAKVGGLKLPTAMAAVVREAIRDFANA